MKKILNTSAAPAPIGPYNQAVSVGNMLFVSGQIALDAESGELILTNISEETHKVMQNILAILKVAGVDFAAVIKSSIFLKNMDDFVTVNEIYGSYFTGDYPARETVQVAKLPKDVNVEISVIAHLG